MKAAVVSVGAGKSQLGLIEAIRARGLAVIGVDRDPDAPGFARCDATVPAGTHDPEHVIAGLVPLATRFDLRAVLTQSSGPPVATTARVASAFDLPGLDPLRASLSTTKAGFAELCEEAGAPTPRTTLVRERSELEALEAEGFSPTAPLVFKPSSGAIGKHGVIRALTPDARERAYARARSCSRDGLVVAQEFVEGPDVAVVALFHAGSVREVCTLDERTAFDADGEVRGDGVGVPSTQEGTPAMAAARAATAAIAARLGTGSGFFAFRLDADGRALAIEAHLDLAGDFVTDVLLARGAGIDLADRVLALHVERALPSLPEPRAATLTFLYEEDRPRFADLVARGEVECDHPPVGEHRGGRVGWLLEVAR